MRGIKSLIPAKIDGDFFMQLLILNYLRVKIE